MKENYRRHNIMLANQAQKPPIFVPQFIPLYQYSQMPREEIKHEISTENEESDSKSEYEKPSKVKFKKPKKKIKLKPKPEPDAPVDNHKTALLKLLDFNSITKHSANDLEKVKEKAIKDMPIYLKELGINPLNKDETSAYELPDDPELLEQLEKMKAESK